MGTAAELLAAQVPCKCGSRDLAIGDFYGPLGKMVVVQCRVCGHNVEGLSKVEMIDRWVKANPRVIETEEEPSPVAEDGVLLRQVAGTVVYTDLARAAVLLRELADIVDRAARARP